MTGLLAAVALLSVDFNHDIAPILFARCAGCHRPGEVAPFSLLTYHDAAAKTRTIAAVVSKGLMPPWKPVHGYGEFAGERRLTKRESDLIVKWVESGSKEGTGSPPPAPSVPPVWKLGEPDLILEMPKSYAVAADGGDQYQCFVVAFPRGLDRYVRAWEFQPGSRRTVHHALFFLDASREGRKRSAAGGGTYSCFGVPGFLPSGSLGGWSPGTQPYVAQEGTASHVSAMQDLVMQIHYHPTGKPEQDQSRIGLYFSDYTSKNPPPKKVVDVGLVSKKIDIPPGDSAYKVEDHFTLPVDVWATGIIPHAHYIARQVRAWATLPDGKKRWLLRIDDWDFNWQDQYRYAKPFVLPADTRLDMEIVYDNSAGNLRNPNSPPQRVEWGADSMSEMAGVHLQAIPVDMSDMEELGQALWGKILRAVGGSFYRVPEKKEP
jgi:hypothetical protein